MRASRCAAELRWEHLAGLVVSGSTWPRQAVPGCAWAVPRQKHSFAIAWIAPLRGARAAFRAATTRRSPRRWAGVSVDVIRCGPTVLITEGVRFGCPDGPFGRFTAPR